MPASFLGLRIPSWIVISLLAGWAGPGCLPAAPAPVHAFWSEAETRDPYGLIGFGQRQMASRGSAVVLELDGTKLAPQEPITLVVHYGGPSPAVTVEDEAAQKLPSTLTPGAESLQVTIAGASREFYRIELAEPAGGRVDRVEIGGVGRPGGPPLAPARPNFAPAIAVARHAAVSREPRAYRTEQGFALENPSLVAEFSSRSGLRLVSLHHEHVGKNLLIDPGQTRLFLTDIEGRRFGAEDWQVRQIEVAGARVEADLWLAPYGLAARLTLTVDADELKLGLRVENRAETSRSWKVAFPQLGGVAISSDPADDYYLYPLRGGVIHRTPMNLRAVYGDGSAWWQLIDLFSPGEGAGLALRSLDTTGYYKGLALRKGEPDPQAPRVVSGLGPKAEDFWRDSLPGGVGTAMAFEYVRHGRSVGEGFTYPEAALQAHAGDWRQPMRAYADWAHRVWEWRPRESRLDDVWQISTLTIDRPGNFVKVLFDGKWYDQFATDGYDMAEFIAWWEWAKRGPFGIDLERAREEAGDRFFERYRPDLTQINRATGRLEYPYTRGDYDYNESWGGLTGLQRTMGRAREAGQLVQFYTGPILIDNNTRTAARYARRYGVMTPSTPDVPITKGHLVPEGYWVTYGQWQMCPDAPGWRQVLAEQMQRIVRDTGVDAIRLDQVGGGRPVCLSPHHEHTFAEPGHSGWMQAQAQLVRQIRQATDEVKKDLVLMVEHPGYDLFAATAEGTLVGETRAYRYPGLRPIPINVFRFYFPSFKFYDYPAAAVSETTRFGRRPELAFWNAMGRFREPFPPEMHRVLKENSDALRSADCEPLVPTLQPHVYAHRFTAAEKEVVLLYNDRGFTVDAPLLAVDQVAERVRYFELLSGRELTPERGELRLAIPRDGVAAVARLTRWLEVAESEEGWRVQWPVADADAIIVVCATDGSELLRQSKGERSIRISRAQVGGEAAYVKLLRGRYLVDAAPLR